MKIERSQSEEIRTLGRLIRNVRVAMLTTVAPDGTLVSRPLHTLKMEFDGDLWFITAADSGKVMDLARNDHVNLAYADPDSHTYVSITGRAYALADRERVEELWTKDMGNYFPQGRNDPNIVVLKVEVEGAEYWTGAGELVSSFLSFARRLTGQPSGDAGAHGVIDLPHQH